MNNSTIPTTISQRESYKRKYNLPSMYRIFMNISDAIRIFIYNQKVSIVNIDFVERLQLAVTEVNGCTVCSYTHTQMALKQGISNDEIFSILSGDDRFINAKESKAIFFAQHYAESGGVPNKQSYEVIEREYGKTEAEIILSAIQLIMAGNAYGIPLSAFKSRLKGKPYKDSSLLYELKMQILGTIVLVLALIHGGIKKLVGINNQKFNE